MTDLDSPAEDERPRRETALATAETTANYLASVATALSKSEQSVLPIEDVPALLAELLAFSTAAAELLDNIGRQLVNDYTPGWPQPGTTLRSPVPTAGAPAAAWLYGSAESLHRGSVHMRSAAAKAAAAVDIAAGRTPSLVHRTGPMTGWRYVYSTPSTEVTP